MKNKIGIIVFFIALTIFATGCRNNNMEENQIMENMISLDKFLYAYRLRFHFSIVIEGERILSNIDAFDNIVPNSPANYFHTDLIFVHSEGDAVGFPDNVVLAWPRIGDDNFSQGVINGIHWAINKDETELSRSLSVAARREVLTLEEFGLDYPLTVMDLVDNWEKMITLWNRLDHSEQSFILWAAPVGGPKEDAG